MLMDFKFLTSFLLLRMPVNQVEQGEQVDPDNVDEVPVETAHLERRVVLGCEAAFPCHDQEPGEEAESDDHVEGVQAGHDEVQSKENLGVLRVGVLTAMARNLLMKAEGSAGNVMLIELVFIFDSFDTEEDASEKHGEREHGEEKPATRRLRGPDGEHDGHAAADEDGGVGAAESSVDGRAGGGEISEVPTAINQVGAEQAAEEHNFGGEEDPHAEAGGVALLLFGGEVVQQGRIGAVSLAVNGRRAIVQREPPLCEARPTPRSCKLPRSRSVLPQN